MNFFFPAKKSLSNYLIFRVGDWFPSKSDKFFQQIKQALKQSTSIFPTIDNDDNNNENENGNQDVYDLPRSLPRIEKNYTIFLIELLNVPLVIFHFSIQTMLNLKEKKKKIHFRKKFQNKN